MHFLHSSAKPTKFGETADEACRNNRQVNVKDLSAKLNSKLLFFSKLLQAPIKHQSITS
ncbi:hypothetical protein X975_10664, partial [Stegodyphus mimosarum]